jgi:hypothetical protein
MCYGMFQTDKRNDETRRIFIDSTDSEGTDSNCVNFFCWFEYKRARMSRALALPLYFLFFGSSPPDLTTKAAAAATGESERLRGGGAPLIIAPPHIPPPADTMASFRSVDPEDIVMVNIGGSKGGFGQVRAVA